MVPLPSGFTVTSVEVSRHAVQTAAAASVTAARTNRVVGAGCGIAVT